MWVDRQVHTIDLCTLCAPAPTADDVPPATSLQAATPLSAVSLFFIRDLSGMLVGVLFASTQVSKPSQTLLSHVHAQRAESGHKYWISAPGSMQGSKLDVYAKQWRLFADCLNSAGELVW